MGADVDVEYNFAVGKAELDPVYAVFADDYEMMVFHIVQDEMAAGLNMASVATEEADFEKVVYRNEPAAEMAADSEIAFAVQEAVAMQADFEKVVFHNAPADEMAEVAADSEVAFAVQEAVHIVMDETAAGLNMASVATEEADYEKVVFHNESE